MFGRLLRAALYAFSSALGAVDVAGSVFCAWCFRPPPGPLPACCAFAADISDAMAKAATTKVSIARFMFESVYGARRTEVEAISRAAPASRNADLKEENGSKVTKMARGKA